MENNINLSEVFLIGAGRMGRSHVSALQLLGFKVTAVCDVLQDNLVTMGEQFGIPVERRFLEARALFSSLPAPDLVIIATSANVHAELTCLAAEAKAKKILCEKPMATSLKQCDAMLDACRRQNSQLAINHQMRFMPQYVLVKEAIESTHIGNLMSMNVMGGCFGIAMNGSHYIEAFSYLSDSVPAEVTAWFSRGLVPNPRGPEFFDRAGQLRIVGENGTRFALEAGNDQGHGMTVTYGMQYGHVFVDELEGELIGVHRKKEYLDKPCTRYGMPWDRWQKQFPRADNVLATKDVIQALIRGDNYPTGETGKKVVETLIAAYCSAENNNRPVLLKGQDLSYERVFPWA